MKWFKKKKIITFYVLIGGIKYPLDDDDWKSIKKKLENNDPVYTNGIYCETHDF